MSDAIEHKADGWEPRPGEMHPVDQAFHRLAIKERDFERVKVDRLEAQLAGAVEALESARAAFQLLRERRDFGITRNAIRDIDKALGRLPRGESHV